MSGQRKPSDEQQKIYMRLPDGMRDELKAAAKANQRTMNAEVVARLEGWSRLQDENQDLKQGALHLNAEIDRLKKAVREEKIRADRSEQATEAHFADEIDQSSHQKMQAVEAAISLLTKQISALTEAQNQLLSILSDVKLTSSLKDSDDKSCG